ncbi:MAG: hypothetical protein LPK19_06955 [Hymenobacteraceae bacterium]|nr:hypothetical protein [Hymenobacteraceae bacterium]MDX5395941.1 hypothetical protein [Hymenobacteraceae bacterium]MDX5511999.1 hypothetical protein [Hymenobacteraceae bacterium]
MNKIILLFLTLILVASPVFAQQEPVAQPDSVTQITEPEQSRRATATDSVEYVNFYLLGKRDGKYYYKSSGPFWGGFASGFFLFYGVVPAGIIAAVPPEVHSVEHPNKHLMVQNQDYYKGFRKGAHNKKVGKTAAGFGVGAVTVTVLWVGTIYAIFHEW